MNYKEEISGKISQLFELNPREFKPEIHLPLAESIVGQCRFSSSSLIKFSDILKFKSENYEFDSPKKRLGLFTIRYLSKLCNSYHLGFYNKLEITHWKSEVFYHPGDQIEILDIAYKEKSVKGLAKFLRTPRIISLGPLTVSYDSVQKLWDYRL